MSYDELKSLSNDELTEKLIEIDYQLMKEHQNNHNHSNYEVIDSPNVNKNKDIIGLCIYGICAYNRLSNLSADKEFIKYVIDNVEMFLEHGNIPSIMQKYYIDVFNRGNVDYLNNFLSKNMESEDNSRSNSRGAYTKSTAVGRAMSDKDNAAYASVLLLPALLALVYLLAIVVYFVFIK